MDSWMMRNPGQPVSIYEVGAFIGEAYLKAMTPTSITNSFRKTRIFPFDRTVFTEIDFLPSTVTDRPQLGEIDPNTIAADECSPSNISRDMPSNCQEKENTDPQENVINVSLNKSPQTNNEQFIVPAEFRPPLKAQPRKNVRKNRKKGSSMIATDTPEKEENEREKQAKKRQIETRKKDANKKGKKAVRKVLQDSSTSESDNSMILESVDVMTVENSDEDNMQSAKEHLGQLTRDPVEGEFVLVEFQGRKDKIYYLAKVLAVQGTEYDVSFLRRKSPTQYVFSIPDNPDLSTVLKRDVKLILPKPLDHGSTSRSKNSFYPFNIDFYGLNIR